jgi:hypothetical protein
MTPFRWQVGAFGWAWQHSDKINGWRHIALRLWVREEGTRAGTRDR